MACKTQHNCLVLRVTAKHWIAICRKKKEGKRVLQEPSCPSRLQVLNARYYEFQGQLAQAAGLDAQALA